MDICNPPLLWLDSRCYRLTDSSAEDCVVEAGYTGEFETFHTEVRGLAEILTLNCFMSRHMMMRTLIVTPTTLSSWRTEISKLF